MLSLISFTGSGCTRLPITLGRLPIAAIKGAHEAGMMPIAHKISYFLDLHISRGQQVRGHGQPALTKEFADVHSSFLLEQTLEMGGTQMHLLSQFAHGMRQLGFNALQYFLQTLLANHGNQFSQSRNAGGGGYLAGMAVSCQFRSAGSDAVAHFLLLNGLSLPGQAKKMSLTNRGCFFSMQPGKIRPQMWSNSTVTQSSSEPFEPHILAKWALRSTFRVGRAYYY